jgi:hypothetical protein
MTLASISAVCGVIFENEFCEWLILLTVDSVIDLSALQNAIVQNI